MLCLWLGAGKNLDLPSNSQRLGSPSVFSVPCKPRILIVLPRTLVLRSEALRWGQVLCAHASVREKNKQASSGSPHVPSGCLPCPYPQTSTHKAAQKTPQNKTTNKNELRDFSQLSPARRELVVSFPEARRTGTACKHSCSPMSAWNHFGRCHSCDNCMALIVRAILSLHERNDSP